MALGRRDGILLIAPLLVVLGSGCVVFNDECAAPADLIDPDRIVGYLAEDLSVDEEYVRTQETEIGDLITDAYLDAFNDADNPNYRPVVPPVDAAVENAGGIRDEGFCAPVERLPGDDTDPPPLRRADLREVFPFTNRVVVLELTSRELYEVFEHSVSALGDPEDPSRGFFLQVSQGVELTVDCSRTPQRVADGQIVQAGERVTRLRFGGVDLLRGDDTTVWRVATNDFLAQGNDGYVTFADKLPLHSLGKFSFEVVEDYLSLNSSEDAPYVPPPLGRIEQVNCE
ncbi:MAG: hypothetical protein D6729_17940 [Deltaproteobacteria bacterium]|nr:MAG: hypothetical protein D6729_17940 [Deltaproteobacteria bacterium]